MLRPIRRLMRAYLRRQGLVVVPADPEFEADDRDLKAEDERLGILGRVKPFTMTSRARISVLCQAVEYVVANDIPGDYVECGVWRGGSTMAAALRLLQLGSRDRTLYLFDTFEGMSPPTDADVDYRGRAAADQFAAKTADGGWCRSPLDEVRENLFSTGYPAEKLVFVKGLVEETVPAAAPDRIAILRLDTDWYESTLHELEHLYPRLSVGGVLILDDYGYRANRNTGTEFAPDIAIDAFLGCFAGQWREVHRGYQVLVQKTAPASATA